VIAPPAARAPARFDTRQAARIAGVPLQRLRRCVGAGLLHPTRDGRGRLQFDFVDLVVLRTMRGLMEKGVPVAQIGRVLRSLRRQIGERPLTGLNVYADGRRVVAWDGASRWQPDSGQFLLNFEVGPVVQGATKVAQLRRPEPAKARTITADEWYDLANELETESPAEARAAYLHAIEIDPRHVPAHVNLGCLLQADGDFGGAERHYRAAVEAEPANGLAWYNLGVLLEDRQRTRDALACYERAVWADPEFADAHCNLALLYEELGRKQDAVRHLAIFRRLTRRKR
jgi:DNA-binding transcriptional MerR regulator